METSVMNVWVPSKISEKFPVEYHHMLKENCHKGERD